MILPRWIIENYQEGIVTLRPLVNIIGLPEKIPEEYKEIIDNAVIVQDQEGIQSLKLDLRKLPEEERAIAVNVIAKLGWIIRIKPLEGGLIIWRYSTI